MFNAFPMRTANLHTSRRLFIGGFTLSNAGVSNTRPAGHMRPFASMPAARRRIL